MTGDEDEWNEECGYCGKMTDYEGGIVKVDGKPICRDCLDNLEETLSDDSEESSKRAPWKVGGRS